MLDGRINLALSFNFHSDGLAIACSKEEAAILHWALAKFLCNTLATGKPRLSRIDLAVIPSVMDILLGYIIGKNNVIDLHIDSLICIGYAMAYTAENFNRDPMADKVNYHHSGAMQ